MFSMCKPSHCTTSSGMVSSSIESMLATELAPVAKSTFGDQGFMRLTQKYQLKNGQAVEDFNEVSCKTRTSSMAVPFRGQ